MKNTLQKYTINYFFLVSPTKNTQLITFFSFADQTTQKFDSLIQITTNTKNERNLQNKTK